MPALVVPAVVFFDLGDTLVFTGTSGQLHRFEDALDALQVLRDRGYRLGLVSNQGAGTTVNQVHGTLQGLGLAAFVEKELITLSSEIPGNVGKPARPIFDRALQKAGYAAPSLQSIFVTETASHIAAARGFGWRAILKRNSGACQPADGECVAGLSGLPGLLPAIADIDGTNLDLAPPARVVDGLWAAPIDIHRITATLTFDGATSSGAGDATLEFRTGRETAHPIFDLRQTITAAWLDGTPLPVGKLAHHDFGGGTDAGLRVVESVLAAGSTHTLRVTYTLGTPQASTAGSYQPAMVWSSGPRLAFNFGFTDLGAGRYLEAWVPANLIFDQFELLLELRVLNTAVAHTVITNGQVTALGVNHWRVSFPARFTALSPLLELRAGDTLSSATDSATLPVSGTTVTVEGWKLASSPTSLAVQLNNLKTYLGDNESSTGPYMHGPHFTAFFHVGGMEYEGGTTTGVGALRHETFHSWWARGVKPASQPDAWFDEAWTVYNDNGAAEVLPFNFTDPPKILCPRNPWVRITASGAYSDGYRFWKGVAALLGAGTVRGLMSEFYNQRRRRPVTTAEIEEFLICRTGNPQLVDAFYRFVYGFENLPSTPDLWLRDEPGHTGTDPWPGRFWDSPDLWVRNREDGGTIHQSPESGQDNWFYARVRNRGATTVQHFVVTFNVTSFAGTQFTYPTDFLPCVAASSGFDLAGGASRIVKARWARPLIPPAGTHTCLLAAVLTRGDHPVTGRHVWEHNNLAQKNLTIVDLAPHAWFVLPFVVSNLQSSVTRGFRLELIRPRAHPGLKASLLQRSASAFRREVGLTLQPLKHVPPRETVGADALLDCAGQVSCGANPHAATPAGRLTSEQPERIAEQFEGGVEVPFAGGAMVQIPILVRRQEQLTFGLRLRIPQEARKGETLRLDLIQRDARTQRALGGIAVQINVS